MWMNADVVKPIAKGHDNRSTATSFNLGLVSCTEAPWFDFHEAMCWVLYHRR